MKIRKCRSSRTTRALECHTPSAGPTVHYWILTMRRVIPVCLLLPAILAGTRAHSQEPRPALLDGRFFAADFDGTEDAGLFPANGDGHVYTADSLAIRKIKRGNHIENVHIAKGAGYTGDALYFAAKTTQVLFFKASANGIQPRDNWAGTVSVWLKLNPDTDLPAGFCDPIQITSKKWNDASFFIDFDRQLPRDFRLGVFSDYGFWNPMDVKFEDVPVTERPMITVKKPSFTKDAWTHVVFTFGNINSAQGTASAASLYLNGEPQGGLHQPMHFTWNKTDDRPDAAIIMLGIGYVGYLDNLSIWDRALSADEVRKFHTLKHVSTPPKDSLQQ